MASDIEIAQAAKMKRIAEEDARKAAGGSNASPGGKTP